jgi:hypothetical protein
VRASELIKLLEEEIEKRGNLPVIIELDVDGWSAPWLVTGIEDTLSYGNGQRQVAAIELAADEELGGNQ